MFLFWLYLAALLQLGLSLQIGDKESTMMNVFKDLPQDKCDMIVVSPVPLKGEIAIAKNLREYLKYFIWV